jgi:hypothetical protein
VTVGVDPGATVAVGVGVTVPVGVGVGVGVGVPVVVGVGMTLVAVGVTGKIGVVVGVAFGVGIQIGIRGKGRQSFWEAAKPFCFFCTVVAEVLAKAGKIKIKLLSIKTTARTRQNIL